MPRSDPRRDAAFALPLLAGASVLVAAWVFGRGNEGYQHARHALAVLGSTGMPGWRIANLMLFALPGLLMALLAWRLRARLPEQAGWRLRIGLQLALIGAMGHALQGLLNLDPTQLADMGPNRLHAMAWTLWWLASTLAALLFSVACGLPAGVRAASVLLAIALPLLVFGAPGLWPAGLAQRIGIGLWLGWAGWLAVALNRAEA